MFRKKHLKWENGFVFGEMLSDSRRYAGATLSGYNEFRMYSAQVLDHFQNPRNAGEVPNADARVQIENPACGDVLELTAKIANERLLEIRFRAKGCVSAMACSSALTEMVAGKTVREARELTRDELLERVGGLPEASAHAAYLAMDALQALLRKA